ncbi:MAG: serine/threonine-protein kinase, partial [Elusimicrobiota bacterium]
VFELIEGRTVHSLLEEHRRLAWKDTRAILEPVCRALEFAHERGIVHRDLKPANVMITNHGQIKVMDFGLARNLRQKGPAASGSPAPAPAAFGAAELTRDSAMTNTFSGTPVYAAPEAIYGLIVPQSDVYALGIMAYRMLGGALPFSAQAALDGSDRRYPPLSQLWKEAPAGLDGLIASALEPDPQKRLASPRLFRERLAAL